MSKTRISRLLCIYSALFFILLAASVPNAMAEDWVKIYPPDETEPLYEVDRSSIVRNGNLVEFWSLADMWIDFIEEYIVADCQAEQMRVLKRYDENGRIEYPSYTDKWGKWFSANIDKDTRAEFDYVCNY